ncbi:MAG: radical SAM protein [Candidatus Omnitrophica bacterium]|nr:radical SAM protein [Candidatus Omnitrophota bacterium]MBU1924084.1 radical SAM protein [Candidatus Omnitrophota bacterium]
MLNLKEIIFSITNRCNLRCKMCDIPYGEIEELSTEQWMGVIKDASRLGAQTVVFSGGEPLLREDIFELISFTKKNNLNACVTSNGHLIDEQAAFNLSASGVNVVNISIEGTKETHDYLRGHGSFDKAIAALDNLRKYKIEATVASTVSRLNYKDLLYVLEVAKNSGATTVRLQPFNIIFLKDCKRQTEFLIDKRDIQQIEDVIKRFVSISKEYKISTNPASYLFKIPAYLTGDNSVTYNCGALWYSCPINPNGDVFPCWIEGANNKLVGNVKEGGLYALWLSKKRINMVNYIINNGCNGCLMSCYDEVFDQGLLKERIIDTAKKMRKATDYKRVINKVMQSLKGQITKSILRYKFYISYRGSLSGLLKRRLHGFINKPKHLKQGNQIAKDMALLEIRKLKIKIKNEIRWL